MIIFSNKLNINININIVLQRNKATYDVVLSCCFFITRIIFYNYNLTYTEYIQDMEEKI